MATGFLPDEKKKVAAGDMPQFMRPQRAPGMLADQINPVNAAMVNNGRSPVGQPGPVSPAPANTALNLSLPRDPSTMIQGADGVTAPGQAYTGRNLVPAGPAYPVSDSRALVPVDAGRGFTPPTGGAYDRNTIFQGTNTAAPSNLATAGGSKELALTGDAGRATTSMGRPANPSFADNGQSIEGEAYRIQRFNEKYSKVPGAPSAPAAVGFKAVAGNVAKNLGLGAVGFGAARLMDNMGNNAPDAGPETRANVNAIPTGGNAPAPAAGQPTGWWDTNTGRNVGNTLNAVTPFLGPLAGTVRAGSNVSRLANTGAAVIGGMAAGATSPEIPFAAPDTASAGRGTTPDPRAANAPAFPNASVVPNPLQDDPAAPASPAAPANNITREGNSYSGNNITDGFTINGQPPRNGGAISAQNQSAAQAMSDRYQAEAARGFTPGTQAGSELTAAQRAGNFTPTGGDTGGFGLLDRSVREKRNADVTMSSITANKTQKQVAAAEYAAINARDAQAASEAGNMTRFGMQDATARRGQDAAFSTSQAGNALAQQRLGLEGQELGLKQTAAGFQNRAAKRIEDLQTAYEAAPADQKGAIAEQLRVMTGKDKPAQWKAIALQGSTDAMGNKTEGVLAAVNEQTGESRRLDQGGAKSATAIPAQAAAMLKANPKMAAEFDAKYGAGAAARTMGQK